MKKLLIFLSLILVASCAPQLQAPRKLTPGSFANNLSKSSSGVELEWWLIFDDPLLDTLIRRALRQNYSLAATLNVVEAARYNLGVARSEYLPKLGLLATASRVREDGSSSNEFVLKGTASWQVPLFGSLKATTKDAQAQISQSIWVYRGASLTLTSEVANAYYSLMQYEASLEIAKESFRLRNAATILIDSMYKYGAKSGVELAQSRALVLSAEQDIYIYERSVQLAKLSLAALLGETTQSFKIDLSNVNIMEKELPEAVPVGLPSEMLEARPDVMQSLYKMEAAAAQVGLARAARFPSLSLTANGGLLSSTLKNLTSGAPWSWEFMGSLVEPLYSFGGLKRKEKAANEEYLAALNDYQQAIINALSDVEKALVTIDTYNSEIKSAAMLAQTNMQISRATSQLYLGGDYDYFNVVDAQRDYYTSQIAYIEIFATQYINYINLFVALGGGWNTSDI